MLSYYKEEGPLKDFPYPTLETQNNKIFLRYVGV